MTETTQFVCVFLEDMFQAELPGELDDPECLDLLHQKAARYFLDRLQRGAARLTAYDGTGRYTELR